MFLIRRIYDDVLPVNKSALREVRQIFLDQFPDAPLSDIDPLPDRLRNPFRKRFRTVLYVAENSRHHVLGFAIVLHEPEIGFCYLDFLAAGKKISGGTAVLSRRPGYATTASLYQVTCGHQAGRSSCPRKNRGGDQ